MKYHKYLILNIKLIFKCFINMCDLVLAENKLLNINEY